MDRSPLAELVAKISQLAERDDALEVSWVGPSTDEAISTVETALGVNIRGSYRDFVLLTGGGGMDTLYISPIPKDEPLSGCYSDTLWYRESWCTHRLPAHLVVIQRDLNDNEPTCLDTSVVKDGENPVVLAYYQSTGHIEKIADSFLKYYQKWLEPYFDGSLA
jgi:hypothetical protein